jgi:hypothetical protein
MTESKSPLPDSLTQHQNVRARPRKMTKESPSPGREGGEVDALSFYDSNPDLRKGVVFFFSRV